jgi:chromosome partitioning protein
MLSIYGRDMMIVLANTKGGVGKSTLAVHVAVWLHDQGCKSALLDTDKQRSSSQWVAEAEPGITVHTADSPEKCLSDARRLLQGHDFLVGDGPGGLDDLSRALLILADLALFPISPSILDLRSVTQATTILRFAQGINNGRPDGQLILNKMRKRDTISRELRAAATNLGVGVAQGIVRDLQAFRDAAQQGSVVGRMGKKTAGAAAEIDALCRELLSDAVQSAENGRSAVKPVEAGNG